MCIYYYFKIIIKKSKNGSYTHTHMFIFIFFFLFYFFEKQFIFILIILYIRSLINVCMDAGVTSLGLYVFTIVMLVTKLALYMILSEDCTVLLHIDCQQSLSNRINHGCAFRIQIKTSILSILLASTLAFLAKI